jgi:hypothetical protein
MIVTNRPPRRNRSNPPSRARSPAQPAEIATPQIVQHVPKHRREPKPRTPDPVADARVKAFFERMGLTLPEDWSN